MIDLKRHCPTCNVNLKITEQMRDQAVRCPKCKAVLAPTRAPEPEIVEVVAVDGDVPPRLPNLELDDAPPKAAPRPQKKEAPPPKKEVPPRPSRKQEEPPPRRSRRDEEEDEPPRRRPRRDEDDDESPRRKSRRDEDDPVYIRGRKITKGGRDDDDDDDDDLPPVRHRDDVPEDVMKRARAISLKLDDLPEPIREKVQDELADREKIVWIGRPDKFFGFVRGLPVLAGAMLFLFFAIVLAVVMFWAGVEGGGAMFSMFALFIAFIAGLVFLYRLVKVFIPNSTTYVLTSRRALVTGWTLFGGYFVSTYGPEYAACPRIRRSWIMRNSGDLVMRTLIRTTISSSRRGVSVSRTRTFYGFICIRNLDEVDSLCADTLGHYFEELVRPKAYWDFYDVMRYVGWVGVPAAVMIFCLITCFGGFGSKGLPGFGGGNEADYAKQPWQVQTDPGPRQEAVQVAKANPPINLGPNKAFYPHQPSPYVAVGLGKNDKGQHRFQIYDLNKWGKNGPVIQSELEDDKRLALSPDGKLIATRHRGQPTTMQFRGPFMPNVINFKVEGDPGWVIDQVEFANNDRIVIMAKKGEGASLDSEMRFLVYDTSQRKQISSGAAPRQFHPRHASFSVGGTYLAMVVGKGKDSFIAFWDLRESKLCGAIAIDEEGEPGGLAFSPDGNSVALLLKAEKGGEWGRLVCWNLADRAKVHNHVIQRAPIEGLESLHQEGGKKSLAWLPDGKGWLLFSHVVYDRDSGGLVGRVQAQTNLDQERLFRGNGEATNLNAGNKTLGVIALPKR